MRIVYHHRTLADGAEGVHIHSMIRAFEHLGHEVVVEALAKPREAGRGDAGLLAKIRERLPQAVFELGTLAANAVEFAIMRRRLRALAPAFVYKRHALFDLGTVFAATLSGIPVVLEVNRLYASQTMRQFEPLTFARLAARLERRVIRLSTLVLAVSTPLRRQIEQVAGSGVNVLVVPNGADPGLFDPTRADGREIRDRYGLQSRFVVGWVGVLRAWHGLDLLLHAVQQLPDASVLIVGDGPARPEIERLAEALGMSERIRITGRIDHKDVAGHVAGFDIAVASDDRTGFASPMKIIEYMAMGCPVVVPRLENFLDIVEDGRTGLAFRPSDAQDLARHIEHLHVDVELRRRLGQNARAEVLHRLNWERNAQLVLNAVSSNARTSSPEPALNVR